MSNPIHIPLYSLTGAAFLAMSSTGQVLADASVDADVFFAACPGDIQVTQDTRVTGLATVTGNCSVNLDPNVAIEFIDLDLSVVPGSLALTGDTAATIQITASELITDSSIEISAAGDISVKDSGLESLNSSTQLILSAGNEPAAIDIKNSILTGASTLSVISTRPDVPITIKDSLLQSQSFLSVVATGENSAVEVKDSTLESSNSIARIDSSGAHSPISAKNTILVAKSWIRIQSFREDSPVEVKDTILDSAGIFADITSQAENSAVTVKNTTTKGQRSQVVSRGDHSPVEVKDSTLEATRPFRTVQIGSFSNNDSAVSVKNTILKGSFFSGGGSVGASSAVEVKDSLFIGATARISSSDVTEAKGNDFTEVTAGGVTIRGTLNCLSIDNTPDIPCAP